MNEAPDPNITSNFKSLKIPLKKVLKHYNLIQPKIEEAVKKVNKFVTLGYEFLRLYILKKYDLNHPLPLVNKKFITDIFRCISTRDNRGRKASNNSDIILFYEETFSKLYPIKLDFVHLKCTLALVAEEMVTCFETNLKTHFLDYLNTYVNISYRNPRKEIIKNSNLSSEEEKIQLKELYRQIKEIKKDLYCGQIQNDDKPYRQWVNTIISHFLPNNIKKCIPYDLQVNPQKYLLMSLSFNEFIEKSGKSPYQVAPQRKNLVLKHITMDTASLIEILNDTKKEIYSVGYSEMSNHVKKYQKHTWREVLKLETKSLFDYRGYLFHHQIQTDGISCSLLFIRKDYRDKKPRQKMPQEKEISIVKLKDLTTQEHQDKTLIGVDPGKKALLTMTDGKGTFYSYSNARRKFECYGKTSSQIILQEKKKEGIIDLETTLSQTCGKSYNLEKYQEYLQEKRKNLETLTSFYQRPLFRKLALRRYCRTQSCESKMLNEIEEKFGDNLLIGLGNWSNNVGKQMKGCMSSPNKGLLKILSRKFQVVEVDEFRTSKIYHNDLQSELTNVKINKKSIHGLLTLKGKPMSVILNRDKNASRNIQLIMETYIKEQKRPSGEPAQASLAEIFCRHNEDSHQKHSPAQALLVGEIL